MKPRDTNAVTGEWKAIVFTALNLSFHTYSLESFSSRFPGFKMLLLNVRFVKGQTTHNQDLNLQGHIDWAYIKEI